MENENNSDSDFVLMSLTSLEVTFIYIGFVISIPLLISYLAIDLLNLSFYTIMIISPIVSLIIYMCLKRIFKKKFTFVNILMTVIIICSIFCATVIIIEVFRLSRYSAMIVIPIISYLVYLYLRKSKK